MISGCPLEVARFAEPIGSTSFDHIKAALVTPENGVIHVARRATVTHAVAAAGVPQAAELLAAVSSAVRSAWLRQAAHVS